MFRSLSYESQVQIERLVHHKHVQREDVILSPHDTKGMLIVEHGQVRVTRYTTDGKEHLQTVLGSGDHVGESWLFGHSNEDTFIIADKSSDVCFITAENFHNLLVRMPDLSFQLLKATFYSNNQL